MAGERSGQDVFSLLEKLQSNHITIHQNRCIQVRNRNAHCMRCAEVCTSGCISYEDGQLSCDLSRCIGCSSCATACPTCAIEAHGPNDAELLRECEAAMRAADGQVVIACRERLAADGAQCDLDKVAGVRCLGRVEESLLVTLAARGAQGITLVGLDCESCPHKTGRGMAEQVRDTTDTLLETWNSGLRVQIAQELPEAVLRALDEGGAGEEGCSPAAHDEAAAAEEPLRSAVEEAPGAGEQRYQRVMEDGTLPHFLPDRRDRLLNSLAELGEPQEKTIETRLWGHVSIDEGLCKSCQMCAAFCPTGALAKFEDEDGDFGIEHSPADCVKCRCCEQICLGGALSIDDEVFAPDLLSGAVERHVMKEGRRQHQGINQITHTMRELLGNDQVYER